MSETRLTTVPTTARPRSGGRALLTAAVLVNAAVLVVGSTVAAFTGKDSVAQTSTSGTVSITLDASGRAAVQAGVTGLAAGDWFERVITVSAGEGLPIGSWTLSTAATTSSVLDTTKDDGLLLKVEQCDGGSWVDQGTGGTNQYACGAPGVRRTVLSERDIVQPTPVALPGLSTTSNALLLTVRLSPTAPDALQSKSSTISYTFAGVQRAGQAR